MKNISNIHKKFIKYYILSLDPIKAALEAGYSKKNAASVGEMLLNDNDIIESINSRLCEQTRNLSISKAYIVKKLVDIIEYSLNDSSDIDTFDFDSKNKKISKPTKKLKDVQVALKALENLCKQLENDNRNDSSFDEESDMPKITIIDNLSEDKL